MENKKRISLDEIYPAIKDVLQQGGYVEMPITGTSMFPLLKSGRDAVIIKAESDYSVGDIIFYRRNDGHFVLHRIVGEANGEFTLCGDNQTDLETGITRDNIIAKVIEISRGEDIIDVNDRIYKLCVKFWIKALPYRRIPLVIMRKLSKLYG